MSTCHYCDDLKERLDNLNVEYEDLDITLEENKTKFEKICEITKGDSVPVIIAGKHILAPDISFKTIEEASLLAQKFDE